MTKLRHYDNLGTVRFVTFSCYRRVPYMIDDRAKTIFVKTLDLVRTKHHFKILGYVLMPEHVHLVINPPGEMKLGLVIRELKSKMAREYFAESAPGSRDMTHVFWQRRCFDHNCRTPVTVIEKINYCHKNPVVRGLVKSPEEWEFSSYNFYQGRLDVPLAVDTMEM